MKRFTYLTSLASLLIIALVTGCSCHLHAVKGSGNVTEQVRPVSDFDNIVLKGCADIYFTQGDKCELKVITDDNLMDKIETKIDGRSLIVKTRSMSPSKLEIHVSMKNIKGFNIKGSGNISNKAPFTADNLYLNVSGSGDMKLNNITAKGIKVEINGAGDISANGKSDRTQIDISGSGNINFNDMEADDVKVKISGSGDCSVFAKSSLKTEIYGSGNISYRGEPKNMKSINVGTGDIKKIK